MTCISVGKTMITFTLENIKFKSSSSHLLQGMWPVNEIIYIFHNALHLWVEFHEKIHLDFINLINNNKKAAKLKVKIKSKMWMSGGTDHKGAVIKHQRSLQFNKTLPFCINTVTFIIKFQQVIFWVNKYFKINRVKAIKFCTRKKKNPTLPTFVLINLLQPIIISFY